MIDTKDIGLKSNEFIKKINEYNAAIEEINSIFRNNIDKFEESIRVDTEKSKEVKDKYLETISKITSIKELNINNITSSLNINDLEYTPENIEEIIKQHEFNNNYLNNDLSENTLKVEFININDSNLIQEKYTINKTVVVKRNSDIKCINFGISFSQFNMSHFENEIKYDDENIIHRYYKGSIIFNNIFSNPEVKVFTLIPDNEILKGNTCGPEFLFSFDYDINNIYITCKYIKPYRFDWKETFDDVNIFDMFDQEHFSNSKINLYASSYFYEVGNRFEVLESSNNINSDIRNIDTYTIKPLDNGFYKYLNFTANNAKINTPKNKKYNFFSHRINETVNDISIFNNIKYENINSLIEFINEENVEINDVMIKNSELYFATNYGLYKKDILLDKYIRLIEGNFIFIKKDENNNLLTYDLTRHGVIINKNDIFDIENLNIINENIDIFENELEVDYIEKIKSFSIRTEDGLYLISKDFSQISKIYEFDSEESNGNDLIKIFDDKIAIKDRNKISIYSIDSDEIIYTRSFDDESISDFFNFVKEGSKYSMTYMENGVLKMLYNMTSFNSNSETVTLNLSVFSGYDLSTLRIFYHPVIDSFVCSCMKNDGMRIVFGCSIVEIKNNELEYKNIIDIEYDNENNTSILKYLFDIDKNSGDYIQIFNGVIGLKCISNRYNKLNDISSIRNDIHSILNKEKSNRTKSLGVEYPVPYKIKVYAKNISDSDTNFNELDSVYNEIGIYNGRYSDLMEKSDYNIFYTSIGLFVVNKIDHTKCYWASNRKNPKLCGDTDNINNIEFEKIDIPMGWNKLINTNYEMDTYVIFEGDDKKNYVLGYNTNRLFDSNKDETVFYSSPKLINFSSLNINNYICNTNIEFDNYKVLINNIEYYLTYRGKIYRPKNILFKSNKTIVIEDEYRGVWIKGYCDGFLPNSEKVENFEKITPNVNISNIQKIVTNENRTYILTDSYLYVSSDFILHNNRYYNNPVGLRSDKINIYFKEIDNLPFELSEIKDIQISELCSYILLNDGKLYGCGLNIYGELGVDEIELGKSQKTFVLINENVNKMWVGKNSIFIKKENNIYRCGNNDNNKLGNDERIINTFTKIKTFNNKDIYNIYQLTNNTIVIDSDNNFYVAGLNDKNQINESLYKIQSFNKTSYEFDYINDIYEIDDSIVYDTFVDTIVHGKNHLTIDKIDDNDKYIYLGNNKYLEVYHEEYENINKFKIIYDEIEREIEGNVDKFYVSNDKVYLLINEKLFVYYYESNSMIYLINHIKDFYIIDNKIIKLIKTNDYLGYILFDNKRMKNDKAGYENEFYLYSYGCGLNINDNTIENLNNITYDIDIKYFESYYGFDINNYKNKFLESISYIKDNNENNTEKVSDFKTKSNIFGIIKMKNNYKEVLENLENTLDDIDNSKIYSIELEILSFIPKYYKDKIEIAHINDNIKKKIISKLI